MPSGRVRRCFKNVEYRDYCTLTEHPNLVYLSSIRSSANFWDLNLRPYDHQLIEYRPTRVFTTTRVKRSKATTVYYSNSRSRPILQLIHDIELNHGPNNYSTNGSRIIEE